MSEDRVGINCGRFDAFATVPVKIEGMSQKFEVEWNKKRSYGKVHDIAATIMSEEIINHFWYEGSEARRYYMCLERDMGNPNFSPVGDTIELKTPITTPQEVVLGTISMSDLTKYLADDNLAAVAIYLNIEAVPVIFDWRQWMQDYYGLRYDGNTKVEKMRVFAEEEK